MHVRDGVESDAETLASLVSMPRDVMRNVVHDRTVRVAELDDGENTTSAGSASGDVGGVADDGPDATILGFVSFDAQTDAVHVTQLAGPRDACERLLDEPVRFGRKEGLSVEVIVGVDDDERRTAVEAVGFEKRGPGPMFEGERTVRYRLSP